MQPVQPGLPGPMAPPPKRAGGFAALVVAVGLVAATSGAGVVWIKHNSDSDHAAKAAAAAAKAAPTSRPSGPVPTSASATPTAAGTAPPGWKVAAFVQENYAYNVPSEWSVVPDGQGLSFNTQWKDPSEVLGPMLGEVSTAPFPGHPDCSVAFMGATASHLKSNKPVDAANAKVRQWAYDMLTSANGKHPALTVSQPRYLRMGSSPAVDVSAEAVATVDIPDKTCGTNPKGQHQIFHAFAVQQPDNSCLVFIAQAIKGIPGAVSDGTLKQIIESLRPLS